MFTKIREAARILSYREDTRSAPDIVIRAESSQALPQTSRRIAKLLEATMFVVGAGAASGYVGTALYRFEHAKVASLTTVVAMLSVLLTLVAHTISNEIQKKLQTELRLSEILAPYVGRKLHSAIATLRGIRVNA